MKKRLPAIHLTLSALLLAALCSACGQEASEEPAAEEGLSQAELGKYSHGIAAREMRFFWTLQGDSIDVKISAPTNGWMGIGSSAGKSASAMKTASAPRPPIRKLTTRLSPNRRPSDRRARTHLVQQCVHVVSVEHQQRFKTHQLTVKVI